MKRNNPEYTEDTKCLDKRLFEVAGLYFESKQAAKTQRRSLNLRDKDGKEILSNTVALGPDHHRYNG